MHDLVLKNGVVVTPDKLIEGGVAVRGEKIVSIGEDKSLGVAHRTIDVEGKIIFPGMFDPHFHLGNGDEVGYEAMREDFLLESKEMAVAGVTLFATTTLYGQGSLVEEFQKTLAAGRDKSFVDYKVTCCVSVESQVKEMREVARRGCVDFKFFTGYKGSQAEALAMTPEGITLGVWYMACEEFARMGPPTFPKIHAEDPWVREILLDRIRKAKREDYLVAWAEHSPGYGENLQIYTAAVIAGEFGVPLYVVHLSAKESLDLIRYLRSRNITIIGETTPAFLCGDARELEAMKLGGRAKIQPPIRFKEDNQALWTGVERGEITIIGTDSLPYTTRYKDSVHFWDVRVGLNCQVPATIPLMFSEGYSRGRVDLVTLAGILAGNAAKVYGVYPRKGVLQEGSDADIVVIDPEREGTLGAKMYRGKSDYSIWEGRRAKGFPVMTFLRGALIAQDGEFVAEKSAGQHIVGVKPRGL